MKIVVLITDGLRLYYVLKLNLQNKVICFFSLLLICIIYKSLEVERCITPAARGRLALAATYIGFGFWLPSYTVITKLIVSKSCFLLLITILKKYTQCFIANKQYNIAGIIFLRLVGLLFMMPTRTSSVNFTAHS